MKLLELGDVGVQVQLLQYVLAQLGYYQGELDGNFNEQTRLAVIEFEKAHGLIPGGIVGPETLNAIMPYILGYRVYIVKAGDTIEKIIDKFDTTEDIIRIANPNVNQKTLSTGLKLIIPYSYDIIKTKIPYTYEILYYDINGLYARYPFIMVDSIGESVKGNKLFRIRLGQGENKVTYNGSHHANEWITTPLLMKWIEEYLKAYVNNERIRGYNIRELWQRSTIDIIPMVNPDGVDLVINGVNDDTENAKQLIAWNYGNTNFKDWKANINGVDLSKNYNAGWDEYKLLEQEFYVFEPGPVLYSGNEPESEPEVKSMVNFTRSEDYRLAIEYHTQGNLILWNFMQQEPVDSKKIGEALAQVSGYTLVKPIFSFASYKDWFIKEFKRPAFIVRCGKGRSPLPLEQFDTIYENNEELLLLAASI